MRKVAVSLAHIIFLFVLFPNNLPAVNEKRLALLIGNSNHIHGGILPNPVNDVRAMAKVLETLGFSVMKYENCTQKEMKKAIDTFGTKLKGQDVGLFFYAGHGVQVKGHNYLIPIDAKLDNENDAEYDCVRADRALAKMEAAGSRTNIVILDACRDNPFQRSWRRGTEGSGLAFMDAPSGSLIAYSTAPGKTALDGTGPNSIYTAALLEHISTPGITVLKVFQRVRSTVMAKSGNKQIPWESTSLRGDFYFKGEREIAVSKYPKPGSAYKTDLDKKGDELEEQKIDIANRPKIIAIDGQFIAYDDGTVLDKNTGLMWADVDNRADIDWPGAKVYCETYRGGGYADWRMPTSQELDGLCDVPRGNIVTTVGAFKSHIITKLIYLSEAGIWASEAPDDCAAAIFNFYTDHARLVPQPRSRGQRVLPVRETERYILPISKPSKILRFIMVQSGIVYDTKTGLEWKVGPDKDTTWDEASSWVQSLNLDGGGWRMPTANELETLYQPGKGKRNMTPLLKTSGWWVWAAWKIDEALPAFAPAGEFAEGLKGHRHYKDKKDARTFAVRSRSD